MSIDVFPATVLNSTLWNGQTYEEGTFTVTATGFVTPLTATASYVRVGKDVTLTLPSLSGVSNATNFTLTGIPNALVPASNHYQIIRGSPTASSNDIVLLEWGAGVTAITIYGSSTAGGWPASGTKSVPPTTISYAIASALSAPGWTGQSYEEGSFTVTATGFSGTAPSVTARYVRVGKQVTLYIPDVQGTSNGPTFTLTGLPGGLASTGVFRAACQVADNGILLFGMMLLNGTSIEIFAGPSYNGWTASGEKALLNPVFVYITL